MRSSSSNGRPMTGPVVGCLRSSREAEAERGRLEVAGTHLGFLAHLLGHGRESDGRIAQICWLLVGLPYEPSRLQHPSVLQGSAKEPGGHEVATGVFA